MQLFLHPYCKAGIFFISQHTDRRLKLSSHTDSILTIDKAHRAAVGGWGLTFPMALLIDEPSPISHSTPADHSWHTGGSHSLSLAPSCLWMMKRRASSERKGLAPSHSCHVCIKVLRFIHHKPPPAVRRGGIFEINMWLLKLAPGTSKHSGAVAAKGKVFL